MTSADFDRVILNVSEAVQSVRMLSQNGDARAEMLDRFWWLQDNLKRLVQLVSDNKDSALPRLRQEHSDLSPQITELLLATTNSTRGNIAAVANSCRAINHSLQTIETMASNEPTLQSPQQAISATA